MKEQSRRSRRAATAILTADWHIRPDIPVCRTDDYFTAMERKIDFVLALSKEHDCPILIAGDLGDKPLNNGWPTWLLEWTINKFKGHRIVAIPGQHDLPEHRLDEWNSAGIGVLHSSGAIQIIGTDPLEDDYVFSDCCIHPFPYGRNIAHVIPNPGSITVAVAHQMVVENKDLWPGQEATISHQLLERFPEYRLILTGDNHRPFVVEYEGRFLVNPGSLMRMTTAQEDHRPRIYLWYAQENKAVPVYLPIEQGVISREHLDVIQDREKRFDALIERVEEDVEIQLSYEQNLENYFQEFRTEKTVVDKTWRAVK